MIVETHADTSTWQILAAALGWFIAAALGYLASFLLERDRRKHATSGTRRQVRTLLRTSVAVMDPFFWSFKELQLDDVALLYKQISERLTDRETATTLSDSEYDALEKFFTNFGRAVAIAQRQWYAWEHEDAAAQIHESVRRRRRDERRLFLAQGFADVLEPLGGAVQSLGDDSLKAAHSELQERAMEFVQHQLDLLNRDFS